MGHAMRFTLASLTNTVFRNIFLRERPVLEFSVAFDMKPGHERADVDVPYNTISYPGLGTTACEHPDTGREII